jgi:hypothetical protein
LQGERITGQTPRPWVAGIQHAAFQSIVSLTLVEGEASVDPRAGVPRELRLRALARWALERGSRSAVADRDRREACTGVDVCVREAEKESAPAGGHRPPDSSGCSRDDDDPHVFAELEAASAKRRRRGVVDEPQGGALGDCSGLPEGGGQAERRRYDENGLHANQYAEPIPAVARRRF